MGNDYPSSPLERRDFFISYTGNDRQWAEWIAMQLEQAGYTLFIQAWDFRPGSNFVAEMDTAARYAERTLLVLSPAYLLSDYAFTEWAAAFRHDPKGAHRRLVPVRIQPCVVDGLLGPMVYIDLVSLDEAQAREHLLAGVQQGRVKPTTVAFPGPGEQDSRRESLAFPGSLPAIWNIPFARNPFFTGRDQELAYLHTQLQQSNAAAVGQTQAISGLGGIGKTQLAIEYTYRHRQEYQAVLWARAESSETLNASYSEMATLLNLDEKDAKEQEVIVQAVRTWLGTHREWLLILDNADEPAVLFPFLPLNVTGHLLVTTRVANLSELGVGITHSLEMTPLPLEQSMHFLLQRANLLSPLATLESVLPQYRTLALQIAHELGNLPLALDQAGAYIAATRTSLANYLSLYQQHRATLLNQRRNRIYPNSVATTWNLSFARVEARNPAAADLLRVCALLAPDAIPEVILTQGAAHLGPTLGLVGADPLQLNEAVEVLRSYSLLNRDPQTPIFSMHRLVQVLLQERLTEIERIQWTERIVTALDTVCPGAEHTTWSTSERLLPHILANADRTESWEHPPQALVSLLYKTANYLTARAQYQQAELLCQRILRIQERQLGAEDPEIAPHLANVAILQAQQGKYAQAELLLQRALAISEQQLGPGHWRVAYELYGLASLYQDQGKYAQAEPLYLRALRIWEQQLGLEHLYTRRIREDYASLLRTIGCDEEATKLEKGS